VPPVSFSSSNTTRSSTPSFRSFHAADKPATPPQQ
jgi:hypothetical protein